MEILDLHRRAVEQWQARVDAVRPDQWDDPTPCTEWSVRDLVNHVVGEELWMVPLLEGSTIEEVGDRLDGDVLGEDPVGTARAAAAAALASSDEHLPANPRVHLSYGDEDASGYAWQMTADHLIHGWDLAKGLGLDDVLDAELVGAVATWFASWEEAYRGAGAVGPRLEQTGDPQTDLLAAFGRAADWVAS
jgi:uncharacterized protein (TIGR03086 family)